MFRTILTPLRARFELSPRTGVPPPSALKPELAPEDFARDVLIELMRNSVEKLKITTSEKEKLELLDEIHRVMLQDPCTKDVFREMDGFVMLISVLATLPAPESQEDSRDMLEAARFCFQIISEGMYGHPVNTDYFKYNVGYGALANAIRTLISNTHTSDTTFGLLLGLSLHDFSSSSIFTSIRDPAEPTPAFTTIDIKLHLYAETLNTPIRRRGAFLTLWNFLCLFIRDDGVLRYTTFKIIDTLSCFSHRNQAIVSSLGILGPLFDAWRTVSSAPDKADEEKRKEKQILQKVIKRLEDMGANTSHARLMFQKVLKHTSGEAKEVDEDSWVLDLDVLELIRHGMKSRWLDHFSMEPSALLVASQEKVRGLPNTGITFMAWIWLEHLPLSTSTSSNGFSGRPASTLSVPSSPASASSTPVSQTHALFTVHTSRGHVLVRLSIDTEGKLRIYSSTSHRSPVTLSNSSVKVRRWSHISLAWYPNGSKVVGGGGLRIFIDGVLSDCLPSLPYPKQEFLTQTITYSLGDSILSQQQQLLHRQRTSSSPSLGSPSIFSSFNPASPPLSSSSIYGLTPSMSLNTPGSHPPSSLSSNFNLNGLGTIDETPTLSYNLASTHLLSTPVSDETIRFIHHLGPRYSGNFQDSSAKGGGGMTKMLTYEASTSLNMFLAAVAASSPSPASGKGGSAVNTQSANLMKMIKTGPGISRSSIIFSLFPVDFSHQPSTSPDDDSSDLPFISAGAKPSGKGGGSVGLKFKMEGDVFLVRSATMDQALWKVGGAVVALRLVLCANAPHELSRSIGVLTDGLRNSWQNSDDMERLRGYELLADILHTKAKLVNITSFETLFEFLGVSFANPENSTITNTLAYLSLVLSFPSFLLWSLTPVPIQRLFWEHFTLLLTASRFRRFNLSKARLGRWGVVRRLLFVLSVGWFDSAVGENDKGKGKEGEPGRSKQGWIPVIDAIKVVGGAQFTKDEAIKPIVSFLAANLHEAPPTIPITRPLSTISLLPPTNSTTRPKSAQKKASYLLSALTTIISIPANYTTFATSLPVTRVCLLLLGERPTSHIAKEVLKIILYSIRSSRSFVRKFELVSGWSVLKVVLPGERWDEGVNEAAMDILLGRWDLLSKGTNEHNNKIQDDHAIVCPSMAPIILNALRSGLNLVVRGILSVSLARDNVVKTSNGDSQSPGGGDVEVPGTGANTPTGSPSDSLPSPLQSVSKTMETLLEQLIELHAASASFRDIFRSQQTTQIYIDGYKNFVQKASTAWSGVPEEWTQWIIRILEKLSHLGLALALDTNVAGAQKREILDILPKGEKIINPTAEKTTIDPSLVVDSRSISTRIASASARLSLQGVGERTIMKTASRISEWRKTIQTSERNRFRKNILDMRETRRQVARLYDCLNVVTSERGLWGQGGVAHLWRLDETEGPHRVRKKLEPLETETAYSRVDGTKENIRGEIVPASESQSVTQQQIEVPPWAENYEIAATEEENQLAEDIADDKHRRVRHELEPGDVIETVATVARIAGVDSSPGLLIIGKTHIYMLDGIVENSDGEVIDAQDAPKSLFFVPGSIVELNGPQRAQRWPHDQVATFSNKTFLFRDVGIELYFQDSRSLLVVFLDKEKRTQMDEKLRSIIERREGMPLTPGLLRTPLFKAGVRIWSLARGHELSTAQAKWQAREISNFTYLSILNQISGRTPSDATQYPIFPWVVRDYTSSNLDLTSPDTFRDLTKPMGALTPERREAALSRYSNLVSVDEQPFHYGTHFSSSMIVCHFLIRLAPFTNMFKTLQGGDWDLPDRLFSDIGKSYESAATDVRGDVRELIPEFYVCPEFLENAANHDFGVQQNTGLKIHDTVLPPWAKDDPLLFVEMNRRALESPYVSEHLHEWIDLIWGDKQRDPDSLNCFHPLSYEGAIDLDSIGNELEREATVGIIHNFGQTPRKLFTTPHPSRFMTGTHTLPLGTPLGVAEDSHLLMQEPKPFKDIGAPVYDFGFDIVGEKILPCPKGTVILPGHPYEHIEWDPERKQGSEIRYVVDGTTIQTLESASCTCASFADSSTLVTGCSDYTVRLFKILRHGTTHEPPELTISHIMRNHTEEITCVCASRPWSVVVSGSKDGSAAFWDLNRGVYIRSVWHGSGGDFAISMVSVNESTGHIASCSRTSLHLHTINGRPMATLDLTTLPNYSALFPTITSMAFHEREYSYKGILVTGGSDGTIALRTWNAEKSDEGEKAKWEFVDVRNMRARNTMSMTPTSAKPGGQNGRPPAVTALRFLGESLFHGEETGKSFMWSLPDD